MRRPKTPPQLDGLFEPQRAERLFEVLRHMSNDFQGYPHWDKLRFLDPPGGITREEWWFVLKLSRKSRRREIALRDRKGESFGFVEPDEVAQFLHETDRDASGSLLFDDDVVSDESRNRYIVSSLVEESITSSQLEGASTTRAVAKEMLRTGRRPVNNSERMILSNYRALEFVRGIKDKDMTPERVIAIHRIVDPDDGTRQGGSRLRLNEDFVRVETTDGRQVLHVPPDADELEERMQLMCDFANGRTPHYFVHPVLRAIMLHFWLAFDHPFPDGNGRTARALFYWAMLRKGYWLTEYMSISREIKKAPVKYGKAFLLTETDENDLTYFLLYHLEVIRKSISGIKRYIRGKAEEARRVQKLLDTTDLMNYRQIALMGRALRSPSATFTVKTHQNSHKVVYETARSDLLLLVEKGLLKKAKVGRKLVFTPVDDLEAGLSRLRFGSGGT